NPATVEERRPVRVAQASAHNVSGIGGPAFVASLLGGKPNLPRFLVVAGIVDEVQGVQFALAQFDPAVTDAVVTNLQSDLKVVPSGPAGGGGGRPAAARSIRS